jgi:hypothetical protein
MQAVYSWKGRLFVLSNNFEAFPVGILEAMRAGLSRRTCLTLLSVQDAAPAHTCPDRARERNSSYLVHNGLRHCLTSLV